MLHKLQSEFKRFIETGDVPNSLMKEIVDGDIDKAKRLNIYKGNVRENLTNALKISYPCTCKLVGEGFIEFVANKYVFQNLPTEGSLLNYGADFPDFMNTLKEVENHPFVPDFTKFEWLINEVHNSEAEYPISAGEIDELLKGGKSPQLKLRSCIRIISSRYRVDALWDMISKNKEIDDKFQIGGDVLSFIMITKIEHDIEFFPLESIEFQILQNMLNGLKLEEALEVLENEEYAALAVGKLINLGVFTL